MHPGLKTAALSRSYGFLLWLDKLGCKWIYWLSDGVTATAVAPPASFIKGLPVLSLEGWEWGKGTLGIEYILFVGTGLDALYTLFPSIFSIALQRNFFFPCF